MDEQNEIPFSCFQIVNAITKWPGGWLSKFGASVFRGVSDLLVELVGSDKEDTDAFV